MSEHQSSYVQIVRSSALMGGTSLLNLAVGVIRTKVMALVLGPSGVGLMGTFAAISDVTRSVAEMGINQSGVRQMAEAKASDDMKRIARTATVLRRIALLLGLLGAAVLALFATPIAELSFGNDRHSWEVALLGLAVLFSVISGGQAALLQGLRRLGDLARLSVLSATFSTLALIPIICLFKEEGVVPALVVAAAISALVATWHARMLRIRAPLMRLVDMRDEAVALLRLGVAFMLSGLLIMGAAYAVRIFVLRNTGLEGAGFYQAGWTLGGLYVGFILQAMGTDFYPRLIGQIDDNVSTNRLVNEQARISMLLAGPGVIATLVLAPPIVSLMYSTRFAESVDVLRWICLGTALRVISWPMGYVIVAKNQQGIFIGAELAWTIVNISLSWFLVASYGVSGAGIAFFASYVFHVVLIYPIVRRMTGFAWSAENVKTALVFVGLAAGCFLAFRCLNSPASNVIGVVLLLLSSTYSLKGLLPLVGTSGMPKSLVRALTICRRAA